MIRFIHILLLLILALPSTAEEWNPEPPKPERWDWIQLTSGEWLKGEIIALYNDKLEFDSDELDELSFDFSDIKTIRSGRITHVRFLGNRYRHGRMLLDGDEVSFEGSDEVFKADEILTVTAGEDKESNYWAIKLSLGANVRSGNTDQADANSNFKALRRTVENRAIFEYIANYSKTDAQETANNHRLNASWDKFITDRMFLRPVFGTYSKDPFQNIQHKYNVGTGIGYEIFNTSLVEWNVVIGPAYQGTTYETVEVGENKDETTGAFTTTSNLQIEITKEVDFLYDYNFTIVNEASGKYTHNMVAGLEVELTSLLDIDISIAWDRTENPRANEDGITPDQDDYRVIVGIGFKY